MTSGDYLGRLAIIFGVFFVLVPGVFFGSGLILGVSSQGALAAFGMLFLLGVPVWVLAFVIFLLRAVASRMTAVRLPSALALGLIPLLLADGMRVSSIFIIPSLPGGWMNFIWRFQEWFPAFLAGGLAVVIALVFWPQRVAEPDERASIARAVAIICFAVHGILACLPTLTMITMLVSPGSLVRLQLAFDIHRLAIGTFAFVVLSQIWAIAEMRRSDNSPSSYRIG
jgi:hypothetical protein